MKKDCAHVRKSLRKYLHGHLFKYEQIKIARHLNACPLCRSEFQSLRKVADTKQLLKDITPPEGFARMKEGVSFLGKLKLLFYRPLLLLAVIGIGALLYVNVIAPQRRDVEIENLEKSVPLGSAADSAPSDNPAHAPAPTVSPPAQSLPDSPAPSPLRITVSTQVYDDAVQSINSAMEEHAQPGKIRLSDKVREISGSLTAEELKALLKRIEKTGKVEYSRKIFNSFEVGESVPFKIKVIKQSPPVVHQQAPPAAVSPAEPASAPTSSAGSARSSGPDQ